MSEQLTQNATNSPVAPACRERQRVTHKTHQPEALHSECHHHNTRGIGDTLHCRVIRPRDNVRENRVVGYEPSRRCTSDRTDSPIARFHRTGRIPPGIRSADLPDHVASPHHRPQAPPQRLQPVTSPSPTTPHRPLVPPGNPAPVRGLRQQGRHDTRGSRWGFYHEGPLPFWRVLPPMRLTCWAQRRSAWCIPRVRNH